MATDAERVRSRLGERIPEGGSEADTLFTNQEIQDLLDGRSIEEAVLEGWKTKAGLLSDLVDTAEGTSKRAMSDLHANALRMVASMETSLGLGTRRTRLHRLGRA